MTQIFIFTAGNSSARSHLDDSIINPIDFKKVETSLEKTQIEKLLISNNENGIFCWGAMPGKNNLRNWNLMQKGDYVICVYSSHYRFISRCTGKIHSYNLANNIWGSLDDKTW